MKTIGVDLWDGQVRGIGGNFPTQYGCAELQNAPPAAHGSIRSLFVRAYPRFAATCRSVDEPGIALIASDVKSGQAAGLATIRARVDRHVAAIVGRHDRCDLFLPRAELALRHFVVIVDPVRSFARDAIAPFRILDLRTTSGLADEEGRELRGLRAEGPAVIRCGGYVIFALPIGDPTSWPSSGNDAWECLSPRVYFDELEHIPEHSAAVRVPLVRDASSSMVNRTRGPWDSSIALPAVAHDEAAGTLEVSAPHGTGRIDISRRAVTDGVLLGRYARCDGAGLGADASLSRVHALLLQIEDRLMLVDTASRNGSRHTGGTDARVLVVTDGAELELGRKTRICWRWLS